VRVLQLPADRGLEGARAYAGGGGRRDRRGARRARRPALVFRRQHLQLAAPARQEICEAIIARGLDIEWSGYLNPKFIDEELCALMARSGCRAIEFGTDSGSPKMIAQLSKEFDVADLRRASELCHQYELKFCHSLIFGGPGETEQTVAETITLMDELHPTAVIALTGIRVLPGTGMVDIALRDGQIDADDNLLFPKFYISPGLADASSTASRPTHAATRTGSCRVGHQDEHRGVAEAARPQAERSALAAAAMSGDALRLDGKRALVTGASRGIGRATAEALAAAGAAVAINYARSAAEAESTGDAPARHRRRGRGHTGRHRRHGAGAGDVRAPARALGRRRHRGQQRRRHTRRLGDADVAGGVGRGDRCQPARGFSVRTTSPAADDQTPLGTHHQRRLARRVARQGRRRQLRRRQGRTAQLQQVAGARGRPLWCHRQRRLPRLVETSSSPASRPPSASASAAKSPSAASASPRGSPGHPLSRQPAASYVSGATLVVDGGLTMA
jgi:NAD(P)-dependent dehydrogenase (short-subunit alcohol dehydrogenase family)